MSKCHRVVLTGGPGGGKTTAADLFRREMGEKVVVVPEAATLLYSGGFPRSSSDVMVRQATQRAIYHVQLNLEEIRAAQYCSRVLLCDRGTVDGAVYWPGQANEFFYHMGTNLKNELARYDAVIFFETAAVGGSSIEGGNPARIESLEQAIELDKKLKELWSNHSNFTFIPHNPSFIKKVTSGLDALAKVVSSK